MPACHGEPNAQPCASPPVVGCRNLASGAVMAFCTRHWWAWNAASLHRRSLVRLAGNLHDSVDAGVLDEDATPAAATAFDRRMLI